MRAAHGFPGFSLSVSRPQDSQTGPVVEVPAGLRLPVRPRAPIVSDFLEQSGKFFDEVRML